MVIVPANLRVGGEASQAESCICLQSAASGLADQERAAAGTGVGLCLGERSERTRGTRAERNLRPAGSAPEGGRRDGKARQGPLGLWPDVAPSGESCIRWSHFVVPISSSVWVQNWCLIPPGWASSEGQPDRLPVSATTKSG